MSPRFGVSGELFSQLPDAFLEVSGQGGFGRLPSVSTVPQYLPVFVSGVAEWAAPRCEVVMLDEVLVASHPALGALQSLGEGSDALAHRPFPFLLSAWVRLARW